MPRSSFNFYKCNFRFYKKKITANKAVIFLSFIFYSSIDSDTSLVDATSKIFPCSTPAIYSFAAATSVSFSSSSSLSVFTILLTETTTSSPTNV